MRASHETPCISKSANYRLSALISRFKNILFKINVNVSLVFAADAIFILTVYVQFRHSAKIRYCDERERRKSLHIHTAMSKARYT